MPKVIFVNVDSCVSILSNSKLIQTHLIWYILLLMLLLSCVLCPISGIPFEQKKVKKRDWKTIIRRALRFFQKIGSGSGSIHRVESEVHVHNKNRSHIIDHVLFRIVLFMTVQNSLFSWVMP